MGSMTRTGNGTDVDGSRVALVVCGALAAETAEIVRRRRWDVDIRGVSAFHHLASPRIVEDVEKKLADLAGRYARVVVVYGDCGTGGALDEVLARYGAVRPPGVHCYQWFLEEEAQEIVDRRTSTYFFTDWLVRNWDRAVVRGLGLDRFPWLKETYFGSLREILYLRQDPDPELERRALEIAEYMGLPMAIRDTGTTALEAQLALLMEGSSQKSV